MVDRIRYTGILCYALVSEINFALCIQSNVLKQSVTFDRIVDIRLRLFVKVDNFCIASTLATVTKINLPSCLGFCFQICPFYVMAPRATHASNL